MGRLAERAVDNHKNGYTCSGAVLAAERVLEKKFESMLTENK